MFADDKAKLRLFDECWSISGGRNDGKGRSRSSRRVRVPQFTRPRGFPVSQALSGSQDSALAHEILLSIVACRCRFVMVLTV